MSSDLDVVAWAASGAMALTGRANGPALGPPAPLVPALRSLTHRLRHLSAATGRAVEVDPLALLGERAALARLSRAGRVSCGGGTALVPSGEDWVAVTLARVEDRELVPAWLERDLLGEDEWTAVTDAFAARPAAELVERAELLGLPVGLLPRDGPGARGDPVRWTQVPGLAREPVSLPAAVVVDLSSLWAGPLCGSVLGQAGASVIKVESTSRPDGTRRGPASFFDLLNAGKEAVALDLRSLGGQQALRRLVANADVVIEASRPRALEQIGLVAADVLAAGRTRVWVSITGHGRRAAERERVGFGDDAAVAGGLVAWEDMQPCFCADAVADPTTGLTAAVAAIEALADGGRWLLDVAMARVAATLAGPTLPVPPGLAVAAPHARSAGGHAPALGEHTTTVLGRIDLWERGPTQG